MEEPALRAAPRTTFEEFGPVQRVAVCSDIVLSASISCKACPRGSALTVEADVRPEEILVDDGDGGARGGEDAQEHVRTHHLVVPASNPRQAREDHAREIAD